MSAPSTAEQEKLPGEVEWHEQRSPKGRGSDDQTPLTADNTTAATVTTQVKPPKETHARCAKKVCGCCGIPIYIHWLFPFIVVLDIANSFRYPQPFLFLALSLCLNAILYVTVLIHELGHCAAARLVGGTVSHILIWPLGGLAYVSHGGAARDEMMIALAGPLTHIPQAIVYGLILWATFGFTNLMYYTIPMSDHFGANLLRGCFRMQVLLFCFNLLIPAFPLDGGRIFACLLLRWFDVKKTALILICTTVPIGLALGVWGAVEGLALSFLVALWILWQAFQLFRLRKKDKLNEHPLFAAASNKQNEAGTGPI